MIRVKLVVLILILIPVLTSCSNPTDRNERGVIKVMYSGEKEWFQQRYGVLFATEYPNVDIEVLSTRHLQTSGTYSKQNLVKYIDENNPDVLVLNTNEYVWLNEENYLYDLNHFVYGKGFDDEKVLPSVLDYLKMKGDGRLYGLAPTFFSTALFYNKDLFDSAKVPYPTNNMTWDEVIELAKNFVNQDEDMYGLSQPFQNDPFNFGKTIADYNGIGLYDPLNNKVLINHSEWKQIFELVVDAYKNKVVYSSNDESVLPANTQDKILKQQNAFLVGQSAMTIDNYYLINMIDKASNPVYWDVVTPPVDRRRPDTTNGFFVSEIFSIHQKTSNLDLSWKLVEFVNGDTFAKLLGKTTNELMSRTEHIQNREGKNLEAFYQLKPGDYLFQNHHEVPRGLIQSISRIANKELNEVIFNNKSLEEALASIHAESEIALEILQAESE